MSHNLFVREASFDKGTPSTIKKWPDKMGGVFWKANLNLVVFYYPSASEIWPIKRGGLYWEGLDKKGYSIDSL
jgi:hypothetical protein